MTFTPTRRGLLLAVGATVGGAGLTTTGGAGAVRGSTGRRERRTADGRPYRLAWQATTDTEGEAMPYDIDATADGTVVQVGAMDTGTTNRPWLAGVAPDGSVTYSTTVDGPGNSLLRGVHVGPDGAARAVGWESTNSDGSRLLLLHVDPSGNVVDRTRFDIPGTVRAQAIAPVGDGFGLFGSGQSEEDPRRRAFVQLVDASGTARDRTVWAPPGGVATVEDAAPMRGSDAVVVGHWSTPENPGRTAVARIEDTGQRAWTTTVSLVEDTTNHSITTTTDGDVVVGVAGAGDGGGAMTLISFDAEGTERWRGSPLDWGEAFRDVAPAPNGDVFAMARDRDGTSLVAKLSATGDVRWTKPLAADVQGLPGSMTRADSGIAISGWSGEATFVDRMERAKAPTPTDSVDVDGDGFGALAAVGGLVSALALGARRAGDGAGP